jgi:GNAT superfamily N-acetyltransferase
MYQWTLLDNDIISVFPFLAEADCVFLFQDNEDKKIFYAYTDQPGSENAQRIRLTTQQREQLELMLIAEPGVNAEDLSLKIQYVPSKRNFPLPVLSHQGDQMTFAYDSIIVQKHNSEVYHFSPNLQPRDSWSSNYPTTYLVPVDWTFWGIPECPDDYSDDIFSDALGNGDYSRCTKLGTLSGHLLLCKQMIMDGHHPMIVCDDESADLGYVMAALADKEGPLNEWTGEPLLDVLYIEELTMEEPLQRQGLGSRLLQELPSLCRNLLHVFPSVLAYYPAPTEYDQGNDQRNEFYQKNGFKKLVCGELLYVYAEQEAINDIDEL